MINFYVLDTNSYLIMCKKYKILISAYACAPNVGSEPGMGWNFVLGLSKYHDVHVIVEKRKWEKPINQYLENNQELKNRLRFHFIDKKRNKILRRIWPPSYYWYYKKWQKQVYKLAIKLDKIEKFDLIHQLNMVGFREPGYLWKIKKPFVWGPIGGLENSPFILLPPLGIKGFLYYSIRNLINIYQCKFSNRPYYAANHFNSTLIAATPMNSKLIKKFWNRESELICEVGKEINVFPSVNERSKKTPLKIIWSGQHTLGKNLPLILNSLKKINFNFELHILGSGDMTRKWKKIASNCNISKKCIWYGWIDRKKAISAMKNAHVFCISSVKDLTSSVLLEAISLGLPVITLDHCGFSHVVNETCGIKIKIQSNKQVQNDFADAFKKIYFDEPFRKKLSYGAIQRSNDFSWDSKLLKLNSIYHKLLK